MDFAVTGPIPFITCNYSDVAVFTLTLSAEKVRPLDSISTKHKDKNNFLIMTLNSIKDSEKTQQHNQILRLSLMPNKLN